MAQVIIQIQGSVDPQWSDWFAGMQIRSLANKETQLSGDLPDQAALFGVLSRLYSLGFGLLVVQAETMRHETPGPPSD